MEEEETDEKITDTERRNVILETIGQLATFNDMMHENEEGFDDREYKLLRILNSYANEARSYTNLIKRDKVTKETIPK